MDWDDGSRRRDQWTNRGTVQRRPTFTFQLHC